MSHVSLLPIHSVRNCSTWKLSKYFFVGCVIIRKRRKPFFHNDDLWLNEVNTTLAKAQQYFHSCPLFPHTPTTPASPTHTQTHNARAVIPWVAFHFQLEGSPTTSEASVRSLLHFQSALFVVPICYSNLSPKNPKNNNTKHSCLKAKLFSDR